MLTYEVNGARIGHKAQFVTGNGASEFVEEGEREIKPVGVVKGREAATEQARGGFDSGERCQFVALPMP
jgi:hypothetical protein